MYKLWRNIFIEFVTEFLRVKLEIIRFYKKIVTHLKNVWSWLKYFKTVEFAYINALHLFDKSNAATRTNFLRFVLYTNYDRKRKKVSTKKGMHNVNPTLFYLWWRVFGATANCNYLKGIVLQTLQTWLSKFVDSSKFRWSWIVAASLLYTL